MLTDRDDLVPTRPPPTAKNGLETWRPPKNVCWPLLPFQSQLMEHKAVVSLYTPTSALAILNILVDYFSPVYSVLFMGWRWYKLVQEGQCWKEKHNKEQGSKQKNQKVQRSAWTHLETSKSSQKQIECFYYLNVPRHVHTQRKKTHGNIRKHMES